MKRTQNKRGGGAVVEYDGKRGKVFRIKYRDVAGTQVMETVGAERDGVTRKQAEAELRERLVRVERKGYRKPAPLKFQAVTARWQEEESPRKRWRTSTEAQYRSILGRLNNSFGMKPAAAIRPRDVSGYVTAMLDGGFAAATVSRDLSILHSILRWAVVQELIDRNPAEGIPHPRGRQRQGHSLTPAQVQHLLRAFADGRERVAFLVFVLTGLRRAELGELRWRDVDLIENVIRVADSKTETGIRSIAIPRVLAEELWQLRRETVFQGDDEYVLAHPEKGTRFSYEAFKAALAQAFKDAGMVMPVRMRPCHDLRVTAITNDAIAGAHPIAVMMKAGHANMATTKRYLKLAGVVFRDEAAALEQRLLGSEPTSDQRIDRKPSTELSTDLG